MSKKVVNARRCDDCGAVVAKLHRFHKSKGYCSRCYSTEFRPLTCSVCGGPARVHRGVVDAPVCGACERTKRRCVRCDRPVPRAGIRVAGGKVACPSCAPYYREKGECSACGKFTSRLSARSDGDAGDRICESCKAKVTHVTCTYCRRHRRRHGVLEDGRPYCAGCGPFGQAQHACPGCGLETPGGGQGRCRTCLNVSRLEHEASMFRLTLSREWAGDAAAHFAKWLLARDGSSPRLFKTYQSHINFFERLDSAFVSEQDLSAEGLLELFSVVGLRKHVLPMKFIESRFGVMVSREAKELHTETLRIEELLRKTKRMPWARDVSDYRDWLTGLNRPLRTQRLYLASAVNLMVGARIERMRDLDEQVLQNHLEKLPGTRNNLGALLRFLDQVLECRLSLPARDSLPGETPAASKRLRRHLERLEELGSSAPTALFDKVVAAAFGMKIRELQDGTWWGEFRDSKPVLCSAEEVAECPVELVSAVEMWIGRRGQLRG